MGLKHYHNATKYPRDTDDLYQNIKECNPIRISKILIVFDDVIVYMPKRKMQVVAELFIRGRKLKFSLV